MFGLPSSRHRLYARFDLFPFSQKVVDTEFLDLFRRPITCTLDTYVRATKQFTAEQEIAVTPLLSTSHLRNTDAFTALYDIEAIVQESGSNGCAVVNVQNTSS